MKKLVFVLITIVGIYFSCYSQNIENTGIRKNVLSIGFAGPIFLNSTNNDKANFVGSVNYDRVIFQKSDFFLNGNIGFGGYHSEGNTFMAVPYSLSINIGKNNNYLELGTGGILGLNQTKQLRYSGDIAPFPSYENVNKSLYLFSPVIIGYKRFMVNNRLYFKANVTVLTNGQRYYPSAGLSFGFCF